MPPWCDCFIARVQHLIGSIAQDLSRQARAIGACFLPSDSGETLVQPPAARFVLAGTEALHDKIGQLSIRVRQLEDALTESHAQPQSHPLLTEELLQIKRPLERERLESALREDQAQNPDATNALGSLYDVSANRHLFPK